MLLFYSSTDRYLGCFHSLAIMNSTTILTQAQGFMLTLAFTSPLYVFKSDTAGPYVKSMLSILRNRQAPAPFSSFSSCLMNSLMCEL